MAHDHTIALVRDALAQGRVPDVVRMIEPLLPPADQPASSDGSIVVLRALHARVQTTEYGLPRETLRLLSDYEPRSQRESLSPLARAEVSLSLGWAHAWHDVETHDDARALLLLHQARATFANRCDVSGRCWTWLGAALVYSTIDEYVLMGRALAEAADLLEAVDDVLARRWLAELRIILARAEGDVRRAEELVAALERASHSSSEPQVVGRAAAYRATWQNDAGQPPGLVVEAASEAESLLTGAATRASYPLLLASRSHLDALLRAGRWDGVAALSEDGMRHVRSLPAARAYLHLPRVLVDLHRGHLDAARRHLERVREQTHRVRHRLLSINTELVGARLSLDAGDADAALASAERARRLAEETGHRRHHLHALLLAARACLRLDAHDEAHRHLRQAATSPVLSQVTSLAALRFEVMAELALREKQPERARALYQHAATGYSLAGDVFHTALVQLALARLERERSPAWGRRLLEDAIDLFEQLAARPALEEARRLLHELPTTLSSKGWAEADTLGTRLALDGQPEELVAEALVRTAREALPDSWVAVYRRDGVGWHLVREHGTPPGSHDAISPSSAVDDPSLETLWLAGDKAGGYVLVAEISDESAWARVRRCIEPLAETAALAFAHCRVGRRSEDERLRQPAAPFDGVPPACTSPAMRTMLEHAAHLRLSRIHVLLTGERGTELGELARHLHTSPWEPFVELDCREASHERLDHALLGHAPSGMPGAVRRAHGGTLFLAHVDALPHALQPRLLRVLEEGEVLPVGAGEPTPVRLRVVASTTEALDGAANDGSFDENLYARLRVSHLHLPPLRQRREEIPLRARRYLNAHRTGSEPGVTLTSQAASALLEYDWPGNHRQLRNEMERALAQVCNEPVPTVDLPDLSETLRQAYYDRHDIAAPAEAVLAGSRTLDQVLADVERQVLSRTLDAHDGQVSAAADVLGLTRQGLYKKMKRLGINGSSQPAGDGAVDSVARP